MHDVVNLANGQLTEFSREKILALQGELSKLPQLTEAQRPVKHIFAPGLYLREIFMPAGSCVVGKIHKADHAVFFLGDATVYSNEGTHRITGCETFISKAGVKRALYMHADTWFTTVHHNPTNETDPDALMKLFVVDEYEQLELPL